MKKHLSTAIAGAALATLLFGFAAFAHDHSELNGTWTLVPASSDFAGQPIVQTGTVTIADRDGIIIVERSFMYEGATKTVFYRDVTDSEHGDTFHDARGIKSKTTWDHDVLKVTTTVDHAVTVETYSLAPDGTMQANVVRPNHKPITLVFHRN